MSIYAPLADSLARSERIGAWLRRTAQLLRRVRGAQKRLRKASNRLARLRCELGR